MSSSDIFMFSMSLWDSANACMSFWTFSAQALSPALHEHILSLNSSILAIMSPAPTFLMAVLHSRSSFSALSPRSMSFSGGFSSLDLSIFSAMDFSQAFMSFSTPSPQSF